MATTIRTGASRAGAVLSKPSARPPKDVKLPAATNKLITDMHRGIYPHLYDRDTGKPRQEVERSRTYVKGRTAGLNMTPLTLARRQREKMLQDFYKWKLRRTSSPVPRS
jgi:hypothetical protein